MTIESIDCNTIRVTSDLIETWITNFPTGGDLTLTYSSCTGEEIILTLNEDNINIPAPHYIDLSVEQGVYNLKITLLAGAELSEEYLCYFNECDLACEIADKLSEADTTSYRYYTFLKAINLCDQCSCKYACIAYNNLITSDNDCNCY